MSYTVYHHHGRGPDREVSLDDIVGDVRVVTVEVERDGDGAVVTLTLRDAARHVVGWAVPGAARMLRAVTEI